MKSNKGKCGILHLGINKVMHQHKLGAHMLASSSVEKHLGLLADKNQQWAFVAKKATKCSVALQNSVADKTREFLLPLYFVLVRPCLGYCVQY